MHVGRYCMRRAMRRGVLDELVIFFVEPTNRRCHIGAGMKKAIYLFMDFDIDHACWFDGTQVLPGDGR